MAAPRRRRMRRRRNTECATKGHRRLSLMSWPSRPCPTWWRTKRNSCCSCSSSCSSLPREGLDGGQPLSSLLGAPSLASGGRNGHNQQVDSLEQEDQRERPRERRGSGGPTLTHTKKKPFSRKRAARGAWKATDWRRRQSNTLPPSLPRRSQSAPTPTPTPTPTLLVRLRRPGEQPSMVRPRRRRRLEASFGLPPLSSSRQWKGAQTQQDRKRWRRSLDTVPSTTPVNRRQVDAVNTVWLLGLRRVAVADEMGLVFAPL